MTVANLAPGARRDLVEAFEWIARENPRAAIGLVEAVRSALPRIAAFPESGAQRPDISLRYRFFDLRGLPYVLAVDLDTHPPRVVRVLHTARDLKGLLGG